MDRVSIDKLESLYRKYNEKEVSSLHLDGDEDGFDLEVKHRLSANEVIDIVSYVCDRVTGRGTGIYYPELKDYYLRVAVLKAYTNLTLPDDERCWEYVYGTPIFAIVTGNEKRPVMFGQREYYENNWLDVEQYEQILDAIDRKIEYILDLDKGW